jgi:hypothetical protein
MDELATHCVFVHTWVSDLKEDVEKTIGKTNHILSVHYSYMMLGRPTYCVYVSTVGYSDLKKLSRKGWYVGTINPISKIWDGTKYVSGIGIMVGRKN